MWADETSPLFLGRLWTICWHFFLMLLDCGFIYGSDFEDVTSSDSLQRLETVITQFSTQWKAVTLGAGAFVCHNSRRSAWSGSVPPPQLARCSAVVALVGHSHDSFHVLLREGGRETETEALRSPQVFIIQRRRRRRRHTCSSEHTETAEKRL